MGKFSFLLVLILLLNITCCVADTEVSDWAREEVEQMLSLGVIPMELQNEYQMPISRAEFAACCVAFYAYQVGTDIDKIVNQYPLPQEDVFTDIVDSRYRREIQSAYALKIVSGKGNQAFDPEAFVTREEAAAMLLRLYFCYGSAVKLGAESARIDEFSDFCEISSWADTAVRYLYQWDVMKGVSDGYYAPKAVMSREQCYVALFRLLCVFG